MERARWLTRWVWADNVWIKLPSFGSQILIVLSCEDVYIRPVPPHRTQVTEPLWPVRTLSTRRETMSQIRTVESFDADANRGLPGLCRWYGSHASPIIHLEWPFNGVPRGLPDWGSHSLTVLSMLPVAATPAFGDQHTASTQLVWPLRVCTGVPVSQSHILAVPSPLPVSMRDEDPGENDVASIASPCPAMDAEHREMALTRNTACGVYCRCTMSSGVLSPGLSSDWYRSERMSTTLSCLSSSGRCENRYGTLSLSSCGTKSDQRPLIELRLPKFVPCVPTFPCNVFSNSSKFFTVASAIGTATAGPVEFPVAWSRNWTRILPRSSGTDCTSCWVRAFSAASNLCRLLGGGTTVAISVRFSPGQYKSV